MEHQSKLTFNCILNPDSLIKANLTETKGINDNDQFIPIGNANIKIFEDELLLGTMREQDNGNYIISQHPKKGKTYRVEIVTESFPFATAETTVPINTDIEYFIKIDEPDTYGRYPVEIAINDEVGENYYWYYSYFIYKRNNKKHAIASYSLYCPYFDDFNKKIEPEIEPGYYYPYMVRIKDIQNDGGVLSWKTNIRNDDKRDTYHIVLEVDEHYDKYLKTSIQMWMQESQTIQLNEPVPIYSNVENGYGIFGSNVVSFLKY